VFDVDTVFPLIEYTAGTSSDNSNQTNTDIFVNVSVNEINEDSIIFLIYNSVGLYNSSSFSDSRRSINFTGLADDTYTFNVTVNDNAGNVNTTLTRTVIVDTGDITFPNLSFVSPTPFSGDLVYEELLVNVSFTDAVNVSVKLFDSQRNLVNVTTSTTSPLFLNYSELGSGVYFFNGSGVGSGGWC